MAGFSDLIDLYAVCGLMLVVERRRLKKFDRHPFMTPGLAFVGSVAVVYLVPTTAAVQGYTSLSFLPGKLSDEDLDVLISGIRVFLYSFLVVYVLLIPAMGSRINLKPRYAPSRQNLWRLVAIVVVIWMAHLVAGVGLSPGALLDRALHPREYTDLRSGSGLLVYLRAAVFLVSFVLVALRIVESRCAGRSITRPAMLFVALIVLDVLGGSKQSVIVGPLVLLYLWQPRRTIRDETNETPAEEDVAGDSTADATDRQALQPLTKLRARRKTAGGAAARYAGAAVVLLALLWLAFGVMQTAQQKASGQTVTDHIISYEQEAYYSARVIQDYPPSTSYALTGVKDAFRGAVPRSLVPGKGPVGFFARYWRDRYTPNVVSYQATTFGILAEAHMMFGVAGYVLYGAIFAVLVVWMHRLQYTRQSWLSLSVGAFFAQWMYFLVRGGLTGSALLYVLVELVLITLVLRLCGSRRAEQAQTLEGATRTPTALDGEPPLDAQSPRHKSEPAPS